MKSSETITADVSDEEAALVGLIECIDFPCVGAKSALATDNLRIECARSIASDVDDVRIHDMLVGWGAVDRPDSLAFYSFAVAFAAPRDLDEVGFERAMWDRLSALTAIDRARGYAHNSDYSDDPQDPNFALSFAGRAYFVVGLHPKASRRARRARSPVMVFNLHDQFSRLRQEDRYERMREVILARDAAFDHRPNPMIARHGETSEARQYSGRAVGKDWVCPFAPAESAS